VALAAVQIAMGITVYSWPTRMAAIYWTGNLATFFAASQLFGDREWRVRYLDWLLVFAVVVCIVSTVQSMTSTATVFWTFPEDVVEAPIFGPFLYVNQYAAFVELIFPLALYGALTRERGRALCILGSALLFGSVLYSGSRGGSTLILLEMCAVPLLTVRRRAVGRTQLLNTGAILSVAVLWVGVAAGPDKLVDRFLGKEELFIVRREFNQSSLRMIQARPLQGFGLGNWATAYPGFASFDDGKHANQAHNDWLQWAVEGGIPLLLIMLSVAAWAIPRAIRSGWGLGVAAIFIHCLWDYPIQRTGVAIVFFTMMAAIAPYGRPAPASPSASEADEQRL
jgi:O-antigen ligase